MEPEAEHAPDGLTDEETTLVDIEAALHVRYPMDPHESTPLPIHVATTSNPVLMFAMTAPEVHPLGRLGIDVYSLGWDIIQSPEDLILWLENVVNILKDQAFINANENPDGYPGQEEEN